MERPNNHGEVIKVELASQEHLPSDIRYIHKDGFRQLFFDDLCISIGLLYNEGEQAKPRHINNFHIFLRMAEDSFPGELQKAFETWPEDQKEWFINSLAFNELSLPF
ncbi:hypothetical protein A2714_04560 [Candidatus Woesebacteria bacterium RIFCSPHIGHO2_01_FULL_38_9]|uniref:Uncharacterized protein n=2 Tax=Candidatus Woeseibacteriota TaxID=1752722 RepID=A0A1F7Y3K8_9BACT|nr:MAG: hypothetical protein A2714_04560 [Candidatus Woesebacteria bacterium RIFCSPHIGHO2_01_FULL_38_9]OGM60270.1 MAG: hypothetical protein A3A75_04130 [Candidatus Woesebacteria bacterium RIFCSPLOWO2_01_FULL_39_10]